MPKSVFLTKKEIQNCLKKNKEWSVNKNETQFSRTFKFHDYIEALVFVARVSVHAEILKHHPDIELSYGKVKVKVTTHKFKGLTKLDVALIERINSLSR